MKAINFLIHLMRKKARQTYQILVQVVIKVQTILILIKDSNNKSFKTNALILMIFK